MRDSYSLLLPPSRGGARAAPILAPLLTPGLPRGAAQWSRHPASLPGTCPAQGAALLLQLLRPYITPPMSVESSQVRAKKGGVGFGCAPLFSTPSSRGRPLAYSAYSRSASRCRVGRPPGGSFGVVDIRGPRNFSRFDPSALARGGPTLATLVRRGAKTFLQKGLRSRGKAKGLV